MVIIGGVIIAGFNHRQPSHGHVSSEVPVEDAVATRRVRTSPEERERRERVREAFAQEGFKWEPWQKPERGMVFGMIRQDGNMQTHMRYYRDGSIKAEHEIGHKYIEHLVSPRESAHALVEEILGRHGIADVEAKEKELPRRHRGPMPRTRTPWRPLMVGAAGLIAGTLLGRKAGWLRKR